MNQVGAPEEFSFIPYSDSELSFTAAQAPSFGASEKNKLFIIDEVCVQTWILSRFIFQVPGTGITALSFDLKKYTSDANSGAKLMPDVDDPSQDALLHCGTSLWQVGQNGAFVEGTFELRYYAATQTFTFELEVAAGNYDRVSLEMGYINSFLRTAPVVAEE